MGEPKIYVACLASYNAGNLYGEWIDANQTSEELANRIAFTLASSPIPDAEAWAIHDYEGFEGIDLGEHPDLEAVELHARMLSEHGSAWSAYVSHVGASHANEDAFTDEYRGQYSSAEDYCREFCEETMDLGPLGNYIDWERYVRDLEMGDGYYFADDGSGGVYVFAPC